MCWCEGRPWRMRSVSVAIEPPLYQAIGIFASSERFLVVAVGYAQVEFYFWLLVTFNLSYLKDHKPVSIVPMAHIYPHRPLRVSALVPGWCPRLRKAGGRKCLWPATLPTWWVLYGLVLYGLVLYGLVLSWLAHFPSHVGWCDLSRSQLIFIFWVFFWGEVRGCGWKQMGYCFDRGVGRRRAFSPTWWYKPSLAGGT